MYFFIEKHVVLVAAVEVDVERDGGENPDEDVFIRQEGEEAAAHAESNCPVGEDGEPADVCLNVIGACLLKHSDSLVVGEEQPHGKEDAISHEPDGE